MGIYINKGNEGFRSALNGEYVDKSGMIEIINKTLDTERRYTCLTRSRRFGKSMAVDMLRAYFDKSCDSRQMFEGLAAQKSSSFEEHLNKYPVISLDITDFITRYRTDESIVNYIQREIKKDVLEAYPDVKVKDRDDLMATLLKIAIQTEDRFIFLIDEWDAILRELGNKEAIVVQYIDLLRRLFKGDDTSRVFAGVYMTGILPIKKYNTQSALNNFREYSVIKPGSLAKYFGFTPEEVHKLAEDADMSEEDLKAWYDGYSIGKEPSMYNPYSVMEAIYRKKCGYYWQRTGSYYIVSDYLKLDYEGLKDDIIRMLAGGRCSVDTSAFSNDMNDVRSKDDVLTVLIHLGYLTYDKNNEECYIPNKEVRMEMANAVGILGGMYDRCFFRLRRKGDENALLQIMAQHSLN